MQFGDNNDGMSLFAFPDDRNRALMAINNEYTNYRYLYPHGGMPQSAEEVHKAQACEGVSVIDVQRKDGQRRAVQPAVQQQLQAELDAGVKTAEYYATLAPAAERIKHELLRFLLQAKADGKRLTPQTAFFRFKFD